MPLLNYTTKVPATRSIQEIQKALVKAGASSITQDFDTEGEIAAIVFRIILNGQTIQFRLPGEVEPVAYILMHDPAVPKQFKTTEQPRRVAWRIIKDWVEAQMAIVETKMVTLPQVFLPYAVNKNGKTLYEIVAENPQLLLGDGNGQ